MNDLVALFLFLLRQDRANGPFNAVAPGCVTNAQFTRALGRALHRPTLLSVPAFALHWLLGERAELLLYGQWAVPKRAVDMGFSFAFETIDSALADLVRSKK